MPSKAVLMAAIVPVNTIEASVRAVTGRKGKTGNTA